MPGQDPDLTPAITLRWQNVTPGTWTARTVQRDIVAAQSSPVVVAANVSSTDDRAALAAAKADIAWLLAEVAALRADLA